MSTISGERRTAAEPGARAPAPALSAQEQEVAKRLSGGFGWPTVVLAIALLGIEAGVIVLWAVGVIPTVVGFAVIIQGTGSDPRVPIQLREPARAAS